MELEYSAASTAAAAAAAAACSWFSFLFWYLYWPRLFVTYVNNTQQQQQQQQQVVEARENFDRNLARRRARHDEVRSRFSSRRVVCTSSRAVRIK